MAPEHYSPILKRIAFIFLLAFISLTVQARKKPASIDEAILYFEKKWSDKQKENFRNTPEKKAVDELHFSVGVWIRHEWIKTNKDSSLLKQFYRLGISDPNDMSNIILTSLHRKLNNEPIELEEQVNYFIEYCKPIRACDKKAARIAEDIYNKYNIGDSVTIYMDVDAKFGTRNAILHECPDTEWSFDYKNGLIVKGIITQKYDIEDKSNFFFRVKISYLNSDDTTILFKKVKPSDNVEFGLKYLLVKN